MRRSPLLCTLAAAVLLFGGCARQQEQMSYIGADSAKQLALDNSGVTSLEAQSLTADLNTRNGQDYYQVEFTVAGEDYEYAIDALTGVIIEAKTPADARTDAAPPVDSLVTDADTFLSAQPGPEPGAVQPSTSGSGGGAAAMLSQEQAQAKALAHAGLTADQVTIAKTKLDYENGRQVYEVEFYTADYKEYDYEIDACSGDVVSYDYEAESYTPPASSGGTITAERAKEIALAQVPGATVSDIWEFEVDYDDGRTEYEGKIVYNNMEYEFEIDGYSGAIRGWEAEPRYH